MGFIAFLAILGFIIGFDWLGILCGLFFIFGAMTVAKGLGDVLASLFIAFMFFLFVFIYHNQDAFKNKKE